MDSEQEIDEKIEEVFINSFEVITNIDNMSEWSLLTKILFYIFLTLLFFITGCYSIVKKIVLFRFSQIPFEFKIMGKLDGVLRKYLMF